jgi:outer membrane lipoprotein-sorting protein
MKKFMRAGLGMVVLGLVVSAAHAWQMKPQPFSSDMSVTTKTGEKMPGKFYFSPPKLRMDMSSRGHEVAIITDGKTQTSDIIMPEQHMYMETHAGQANPMMPNLPKFDTSIDPSNPCAARPDVTCKKLGTESVNGRTCDKWEFTDKKTNATTTTWIDQKLVFPIKTVNSDGATVEFSNIKEGPPAASLFEIPAGYRKLDLGMMGGTRPQ